MPTVKCTTCGKKIDTSFYGACLDCGTLLSVGEPSQGRHEASPPVPAQSAPVPPPAQVPSATGTSSTTAESRSGGISRGLLIRLGLAGLIFGGSAIAGVISNADRGDSGEIIEAGTLIANDLQVGDCLNTPGTDGDFFDEVEAIPCGELHDLEVYSILTYPSVSGTAYPGDEVVTEWGFDQCLDRFTGYVGARYEVVPDIDITIFWPSEQGWDDGDRIVHCLLVHIEDGVQFTGSLRGREA